MTKKNEQANEPVIAESTDDSELIAVKVAAGLSYEGAVEVIKRQREEDAKA